MVVPAGSRKKKKMHKKIFFFLIHSLPLECTEKKGSKALWMKHSILMFLWNNVQCLLAPGFAQYHSNTVAIAMPQVCNPAIYPVLHDILFKQDEWKKKRDWRENESYISFKSAGKYRLIQLRKWWRRQLNYFSFCVFLDLPGTTPVTAGAYWSINDIKSVGY